MNKSLSCNPVEWRVMSGLADYSTTVDAMEACAAQIYAGEAAEQVWLLEHPPLYTGGTSADPAELLDARFPVFRAGRGGRYTYHGPGQRIAYVMLDLNERGHDVRRYIHALEGWVIATLATLGVGAYRAKGRIGIWTNTPAGEAKIGAIGVRLRKWVSYHGFSINVSPDLTHFGGIIPCGISDYGVTSLSALGLPADMAALDAALAANLPDFLASLGANG